jgi:hypothetical protein
VILDECNAWIKASIREVDLKSLVRATPINENQAMGHRVQKLRMNRNEFWIYLLAVERNLTKRYRGIDRLCVSGLRVCGAPSGD